MTDKKLITEEEIFNNKSLKELYDKATDEQKKTEVCCWQCKEKTKVIIALMSGWYQMGGKIQRWVCAECYPNLPQSFQDMISKEISELANKNKYE